MGLAPGDRVGRHVLDARIGRGGFAEVWRAHPPGDPAGAVALKVALDPADARILDREARIPDRIGSDRVLPVLEKALEADPPHLVLPLVEDGSLRERLEREAPLPLDEVFRLARAVLDGLRDVHGAGYCHLDLKPENVLLEGDRVLLADLGLGRPVDGLTRSGTLGSSADIAGTLAYLAPEVRRGSEPDARADLWAWGVILFEMICGDRPAGSELPSDLRAGVPAVLDEAFRRTWCRLEARVGSVEACRDLLGSPLPGDGPDEAPVEPVDWQGMFEEKEREARRELARESTWPPPDWDLVLEGLVSEHEARFILGPELAGELEGAMARGELSPFVERDGCRWFARDEVEAFRERADGPARAMGRADGPWEGSPCDAPGTAPASAPARRATREEAEAWAAPFSRPYRPTAGLLSRAIAGLLDLGLLAGTAAALLHATGASGAPGPGLVPAVIVGSFLYLWGTQALRGATLGQALLGLRVVREDGRRLGSIRSLVRTLAVPLSVLPLGLGFVLAAYDPRGRALHDLVAGTRVLGRRRPRLLAGLDQG